MKIGIDMRCLTEGKITGVEQYAVNIFKELVRQNPEHQFVIFYNAYKKKKISFDEFSKFGNLEVKRTNYPNRLLNLSFWFLGRPFIDKLIGGVDIFFMPNFSFFSLSKRSRLIVSVHDLSFERFPWTYSFKRRLWHFIVNPRKIMKEADQVLAVSDCTKEDCIKLSNIDPNKIKVIYPKFNFKKYLENNKIESKRQREVPNNYILYIGTIEPRKNLKSILGAFGELKKDPVFSDLYLVIAGMKGWLYKDFFEKIIQSDHQRYIKFLDYIGEEDKIFLYKNARAFVYPSFFEGFGYPPLEAMTCKIPVIASNHSAIPEILSDSAILIDPYRPHEMYLALDKLLKNDKITKDYSIKGYERFEKIINKKRNLKINNLFENENWNRC